MFQVDCSDESFASIILNPTILKILKVTRDALIIQPSVTSIVLEVGIKENVRRVGTVGAMSPVANASLVKEF